MNHTLTPGDTAPHLKLPKLGGGELEIAKPTLDWRLVVVYRGAHCPLCTRYLSELNDLVDDLAALNIDAIAISADSETKAAQQMNEVAPRFPVGYGLSPQQIKALGLYLSGPNNGMGVDGPFAEPGVFLIDGDGVVRLIDISNVPFVRPSLQSLLKGLTFMRSRDYPISGAYAA